MAYQSVSEACCVHFLGKPFFIAEYDFAETVLFALVFDVPAFFLALMLA